MERTGVFISYSRNDKRWLDDLRVHLSFLEKEHNFSIWDDNKIKAGDDWQAEITRSIHSARVALLLVSAHFISSDFIFREELPRLLEAAEKDGASIFPIIAGHCMFPEIPSLARFQAFNPPSRPLTDMSDGERDALFVRVTREVRNVLNAQAPVNRPVFPGSAKHNDQEPDLELSVARASTLLILQQNMENPDGLTISDIYKLAKTMSRKNIATAIREMERSAYLARNKKEKMSYWKLSEKGVKLAEKFSKSIRFR